MLMRESIKTSEQVLRFWLAQPLRTGRVQRLLSVFCAYYVFLLCVLFPCLSSLCNYAFRAFLHYRTALTPSPKWLPKKLNFLHFKFDFARKHERIQHMYVLWDVFIVVFGSYTEKGGGKHNYLLHTDCGRGTKQYLLLN